MLELKEITYDNLREVIEIYDTLSEQDKSHVAPNMYSLAEAYINYPIALPRAIEVDNKVVGFVMLGLDNYIAPKKIGLYISFGVLWWVLSFKEKDMVKKY